MRKFYGLMIVFLGFILCSCGGIFYAARTGNVERIEEALKNGVPIESRTENLGNTALIVAAYSGKAEAVEYFCKKGADVNAQNENGVTALIHAAYYNLFDVAKILLKYNADKTIKDKYGNTALDYANQFEYTRMMSLLKNEYFIVDPATPLSAEQTDRVKSFLFLYCHIYESKDLDKFAALFSPDATENGKDFHEQLPKYRKNLEMVESFNYRIELDVYSISSDTGDVRIKGKYFTQYLIAGKLKENSGNISMDLIESGDSYLVKQLNYSSQSEKKADEQPQWGPWIKVGGKEDN